MRRLLAAAWLLSATAGAQKLVHSVTAPAVNAPRNSSALAALQKNIDDRLESTPRDEPFFVLVSTLGVYLEGYGTVFTTQLNLVNSANISPFKKSFTKEEKERLRKKKADRLPMLRQSMRELLMSSGMQLGKMPAQENVVLAISLFYYSWENTTGLPAQIVLRASRQVLADYQAKRINQAQFDSSLRLQEY